MSRSTALGITPNERPVDLAEFGNGSGWSPSIWDRLLKAHGHESNWFSNDAGLNQLWKDVESLPEWQQIPLVLTFDTGVLPFQVYAMAAELLDEFEARLPEREGYSNHVPAVADLLRSGPEVPLFGMWGTSVSENPFDPWDGEADAPGSGISLADMYLLEQHRGLVASTGDPTQ